jgi:serine/threonine-protein kinase
MTSPFAKLLPLGAHDLGAQFLGVRRPPGAPKEPCLVLTIHGGLSDRAEIAGLVEGAAQRARLMKHAVLADVLDVAPANGDFSIVLGYAEGVDLKALLKKSEASNIRISIPMATYIASELARAVAFLHAPASSRPGADPSPLLLSLTQPSAVLVTGLGEVKLAGHLVGSLVPAVLQAFPGSVIGKSRRYLAPEVSGGKPFDARADIYSLGVVLWELLALQRFTGAPLGKSGEHPHELAAIVDRCLATDPGARPQSMADVERELSAYLHSHFPRFSPRQLGAYVASLFEDELAALRSAVQAGLLKEDLAPPAAEAPHQAAPATSGPTTDGGADVQYRKGKTLDLSVDSFSDEVRLKDGPAPRGKVRWDAVVPNTKAPAPRSQKPVALETRSGNGAMRAVLVLVAALVLFVIGVVVMRGGSASFSAEKLDGKPRPTSNRAPRP